MVDFGELFKYPMQDEKWIEKTLIGGVINIVPIVNFISMGYILESVEAGIKGEATLPVWEEWGDKFMKGLMVFLISIVYMLVPGIISGIGAGGAAASYKYGAGMGFAGGGLMLVAGIVALVIAFFMPMAIANYAAKGNFGAAFEFGEIMGRIKANFGDYMVNFVVLVVAYIILGILNFIPILGFLLMMFGSFYLNVIFFNAFGRIYGSAGTVQ